MVSRAPDGSAGDADYGVLGAAYAEYRRPDPRIGALIWASLGRAGSILNVGAGTGSYEPVDRSVTAVEPSAAMRAQRPAWSPPAIDAVAERLPFPDGRFDAAMTTFSVHQWGDLAAGLRELRRVTRGSIVILTCDPARVRSFWLAEYAPAVLDAEARRYPAPDRIAAVLGGETEVLPVPIPLDCVDGFNEAYYGRPERLLEPGARLSCSAWSFLDPLAQAAFVDALSADLRDGRWDERFPGLRTQPTYAGSLVLIVNRPSEIATAQRRTATFDSRD